MTKMRVTNAVLRDLRALKDKSYKEQYDVQTTKEGSFWLGVRIPDVRSVSRDHFLEVKSLGKQKVLVLCEELLQQNCHELKIVAFDWAFRFKAEYEAKDFKIFSRWTKKYLSNWNDCDDFCTHALGEFLYQFPEFLPDVFKWSKAKKWQVRRASAVSLIYPIRKQRYVREAFMTANSLLEDEHDLVRKGYGWLLKEASKHYKNSVFKYVMIHKQEMPRVSLRYAIEKLPATMKKQAMA